MLFLQVLVRYRSSCRFAQKMLHKSDVIWCHTKSQTPIWTLSGINGIDVWGDLYLRDRYDILNMLGWSLLPKPFLKNHGSRYFIWMCCCFPCPPVFFWRFARRYHERNNHTFANLLLSKWPGNSIVEGLEGAGKWWHLRVLGVMIWCDYPILLG